MKKIILLSALFAGSFSLLADDIKLEKIEAISDNVIITLGPQKILLPEGALGMHYFTDEGLVVLQQRPKFRALMTSAIETYLIEDESIEKINSAQKVLEK